MPACTVTYDPTWCDPATWVGQHSCDPVDVDLDDDTAIAVSDTQFVDDGGPYPAVVTVANRGPEGNREMTAEQAEWLARVLTEHARRLRGDHDVSR